MITAQLLADGLFFGEGPRWHDGRLWFSDFYDHAVKTCTESGSVETVFHVDGQTSGLGWLPDGSLVAVSMLDRKVIRRTPAGELVTHGDLAAVATFHCNDMVVDAAGRAYVGNFGFDLDHWLEERGIEATLADGPSASLALVDVDGAVSIAATDLRFPNGSVITPDGTTLIVAETTGFRLTAFDIAGDGTLADRRVWAEVGARAPDGICLNAEGQVWMANALAPECVLVAEGGEIVETVETSQPCFACMLGGDDGRTLFMFTAAGSTSDVAAASRTGRIETARVPSPHAGRP